MNSNTYKPFEKNAVLLVLCQNKISHSQDTRDLDQYQWHTLKIVESLQEAHTMQNSTDYHPDHHCPKTEI